ncbi:hypothetical protein AAVH_14789 [Aphelenchoides avenae]|nr:hypothetical protein AAVH_14789 [Aphelenchus avenae]
MNLVFTTAGLDTLCGSLVAFDYYSGEFEEYPELLHPKISDRRGGISECCCKRRPCCLNQQKPPKQQPKKQLGMPCRTDAECESGSCAVRKVDPEESTITRDMSQ